LGERPFGKELNVLDPRAFSRVAGHKRCQAVEKFGNRRARDAILIERMIIASGDIATQRRLYVLSCSDDSPNSFLYFQSVLHKSPGHAVFPLRITKQAGAYGKSYDWNADDD
jgi:hypothetical protein